MQQKKRGRPGNEASFGHCLNLTSKYPEGWGDGIVARALGVAWKIASAFFISWKDSNGEKNPQHKFNLVVVSYNHCLFLLVHALK